MGGGLPSQVGLRPGVPRQTLPPPPPQPVTAAAAAVVLAGISFQSAGTLDQPLTKASHIPGQQPFHLF